MCDHIRALHKSLLTNQNRVHVTQNCRAGDVSLCVAIVPCKLSNICMLAHHMMTLNIQSMNSVNPCMHEVQKVVEGFEEQQLGGGLW